MVLLLPNAVAAEDKMMQTSDFQDGVWSSMTDADFERFRKLIYSECGISLTAAKKSMVCARLGKRLNSLGMGSYREYYRYISDRTKSSDEITSMIDVITTNTTEFFRESKHFEVLTEQVLPVILHKHRSAGEKLVNIWSAGCSSGQEPYTLAMVLSEYFDGRTDLFSILATDISTRILHRAEQAVYTEEDIKGIPALMKRKYLMRGKGAQEGRYRITPELRQAVNFRRLNLVESSFELGAEMDIIFCRNVVIYFDRPTKTALYGKLYEQLAPGGYLFVGHSESLNGLSNQFVSVVPTVYRKPG